MPDLDRGGYCGEEEGCLLPDLDRSGCFGGGMAGARMDDFTFFRCHCYDTTAL